MAAEVEIDMGIFKGFPSKKLLFKDFLKAFWIIYALLSVIITVHKADQLITKDYDIISQHISLDSPWDIQINGSTYTGVSLEDFHFDIVNKGDIIIMQRKLPEDWNITEGVLRIKTTHSATRVFIDDELVYEYGYDRAALKKTVGSGYQFVKFPKEYEGKNLKIELYITENKAYTRINTINIYEWENIYRMLMTENRLPMFSGCFLVIFGLSTGVITIIALVVSTKFLRIFCISMFSICIGLWTLCYYKVIAIFSIPLYSISLLEHIALYLAPIPLTIYMYEDVKKTGKKSLLVIYWILISTQFIMITATMILHTFNIVHFSSTLKYMHILIIASLLYFLLVIIMNLKSSKLENRLFLIGMSAICVCILYDLASYLKMRYYGGKPLPFKGLSSIGVMIFIFILILVFYMDMLKKALQETERNSLLKSAYTDELTQLHNRRYCTEYLQKIQKNQICDYTVICFDLNNLKMVNDTYGHAMGDLLIKSAAEVIAETFESYGIVARMGGDEFIAVLETADLGKVTVLVESLHKNIDNKNREIPDLNISMAYGYASGGTSPENDIQKLYQIADDRMYAHKKQMKEAGLAAIR